MSDYMLTFGKYSGKKFSEIPDRPYIEWIANLKVCKQSDAPEVARAFLREHPYIHQPSQAPKTIPHSYSQASKLGWMAGKGYGNARATMLAARDQDGFLQVVDDDAYGEGYENQYQLLYICDDGRVVDAMVGLSGCSYAQAETILARYPDIEKEDYLACIAEDEKMRADQARRTLELKSLDGKHTIALCIWGRDTIDVSLDGRGIGTYLFREPTHQERHTHPWNKAAAILAYSEDSLSVSPEDEPHRIGLTVEKKHLIEQKLSELLSGNED